MLTVASGRWPELAPEEDSGNIFAVATPPDYGSLEYTTYFLDEMVDAGSDGVFPLLERTAPASRTCESDSRRRWPRSLPASARPPCEPPSR